MRSHWLNPNMLEAKRAEESSCHGWLGAHRPHIRPLPIGTDLQQFLSASGIIHRHFQKCKADCFNTTTSSRALRHNYIALESFLELVFLVSVILSSTEWHPLHSITVLSLHNNRFVYDFKTLHPFCVFCLLRLKKLRSCWFKDSFLLFTSLAILFKFV
jgi:hypothetical protein